MSAGPQREIDATLQRLVEQTPTDLALVCTDEGLLVASSTDDVDTEELAGLTGLFDEVLRRAQRDLSMKRVDELTLLDPDGGRLVVRPLQVPGPQRFFLVVRVPVKATWRRNTNQVGRRVADLLAPLVAET